MKADEFTTSRMRKKLTSIGSKIADAVDMSEEMEKLGTVSGVKLKQAQDEVSELYISVGDDAKGPAADDMEDKAKNGPNKKETK